MAAAIGSRKHLQCSLPRCNCRLVLQVLDASSSEEQQGF
jgi:hypothetical protein